MFVGHADTSSPEWSVAFLPGAIYATRDSPPRKVTTALQRAATLPARRLAGQAAREPVPSAAIGTIDVPPSRPVPFDSIERTDALARVRSLFQRADYSAAGIGAAGVDVGLGVRGTDAPTLRRALRGVEPLATLIRLFLLGEERRVVELERQLGRDVAALEETGFILRRGDVVSPLLRLTPWRSLLVAHDPDPPGELWPGHVSGPTPAASTLADLTIRRQVDRAIDVGTGSGLLALLAARHAERVVATDINPAAIRLTALNAALNELPNIETRLGNLFEPAAGSRHDLVVSNPPFVISPESDLVFRHSSMARDELSRTVVRQAAAHLAEDGFAHVLCNWVVEPGSPWPAAVEAWVAGSGCDALLLLHGVEDQLAYAVRWNLRAQQLAPDRHAETLDRWLAYFNRERIEAIASGAVILRRRSGDNWTHTLELTAEARGAAGAQVVAVFAARDYLCTLTVDEDVLDARFAVDAPHRLEQALVSSGDGYVIESASLVLEEGLANRVSVDPDLIPVFLRLDGRQTLREIVEEVAEGTGADRGQLTARTVRFVRSLLEGGLAAPRPGDDGASHEGTA